MSNTPILNAPELVEAQAIPETTVNEIVRYLEQGAGWFRFLDRGLSSPPGSPSDGDCYLVAATGSGAWTGHDGDIAFRMSSAWVFITPSEGMGAYVADENIAIIFDGSSWSEFGGGAVNYSDLNDVNMGALTDGDIAVWDDGAGEWVPVPLPGGGSGGTVPDGGTQGQVLAKASGVDQDTEWVDPKAPWKLIDTNGDEITSGSTWTYSSPVANVDIINLGQYSEIMVIARNVTASASGVRAIVASTDNGSTFYSSSGDYVAATSAGVESNSSVFMSHDTASASARSLMGIIKNISAYGPKWAQGIGTAGNKDKMLVASLAAINAIRFLNGSGGGNLTGGDLYIYAR